VSEVGALLALSAAEMADRANTWSAYLYEATGLSYVTAVATCPYAPGGSLSAAAAPTTMTCPFAAAGGSLPEGHPPVPLPQGHPPVPNMTPRGEATRSEGQSSSIQPTIVGSKSSFGLRSQTIPVWSPHNISVSNSTKPEWDDGVD